MRSSASPAQALSCPRVLLVLVLLLGASVLLQGVSGAMRTSIKKPLASFPATLGEWQLYSSQKSSEDVIEMLGMSDYIEYNYTAPHLPPVNFYVAFYESVGTGGGYHSPKNCLPGSGWGIDSVKTLQIHPANRPKPVTVATMVIRNRNAYQVVVYWYQNRGRIIHSEYKEKVHQVIDAVLNQRRDGAFVRLIAPAPDGNIQQTEAALGAFASQAMAELDNFLPGS